MNQLQKVAAVLLFCMALTGAVTAQQRVWLRYASDVMAGVANPRTMCIQAGHPVPDGWWISGTCPVAAPPAPAPAPAHERDDDAGHGRLAA
ncbi:MAG: hypothetical protein OXB89_01750, partial [Anaerolineaceae bacterium]|nr:hypothetical protein [Anaerolineaceae bacterium]